MTASIDNIVQHLFQQPSLQTVSVDELQQMTSEHPSFAAARFLLLKKMQETAHPDFTSQLQKTSVYFNNPLWLQLLLSPMKEESRNWRPSLNVDTELLEHEEVMGFSIPAEQEEISSAAVIYTDAPEIQTNAPEEVSAPIEEVIAQSTSETEETVSVQEPETYTPEAMTNEGPQHSEPLVQEILDRLRGNIHDSGDNAASSSTPPPLPSERSDETVYTDPVVNEVLDRLREQIHQADIQEYPEAAAETEAVHTDISNITAPVIETEAIKTEFFSPVEATEAGQPVEAGQSVDAGQPAEASYTVAAPVEEAPVTHEPVFFVHAPMDPGMPEPATAAVGSEPIAVAIESEPAALVAEPEHVTTEPAEIAIEGSQPQEEELAPIPSLKIIIETPMAKSDMLFEPYHTIDYFASQGIRLDKMDPNPQDKLGRQLRSFTEWLKSMKKLPKASIEQVLGENEESAVVAAATHSIEGKEVITEAMAEVFEKQGMRDRAIEVYHKLSLLNPSKSAYFADRINRLKYS